MIIADMIDSYYYFSVKFNNKEHDIMINVVYV